ncbi:AdoMet-dependent rRNA methyltransferase spb1 [Phlyctochytrium planicorne]|nr:AdoMet-dependent rRNA methyltransferase spb1 [Phlyctochytrium planicorne]
MAIKKKYAKGRLDKYYHMAKEQGYRARSAFKLIQLNKKYNFLEKAKVCVDLCAAPGGWCQVAAKYMPRPSIIIGIDLAPIKPIPGVITHVEDITSEKCRAILKSELKTWKVDVFLHDGAPNVGINWVQDAFGQSELTLSALKLATEFLVPGGTFVSKVFRSKDYNKLLWVFNQLFKSVEATKPASSRNVSAEIFVVCKDFLAPKKIDPRLLDAKYVFKDFEENFDQLDEKRKKEMQSAVMNDLFHPEKRKRHRDGYADGATVLHVTAPVSDFIRKSEFVTILAKSNQILFSKSEEDQSLKNNALTTSDILAYCDDLRVLGKREFKELIRWRDAVRESMGLNPPKEKKVEEVKEEPKNLTAEEEAEAKANELARQAAEMEAELKREKRKSRERKAKQLIRLRLGMDTPHDIGLEVDSGMNGDVENEEDDEETDDIVRLILKKKRERLASESGALPTIVADDEDEDDDIEEEEDEDELSEDELKVKHREREIADSYNQYEERKAAQNPKLAKKEKQGGKDFEEWYGIEWDAKHNNVGKRKRGEDGEDGEDGSDDEDDYSDSEDDDDSVDTDEDEEGSKPAKKAKKGKEEPKKLSSQAKLFFQNSLFEGVDDDEEKGKKGKRSKGKADGGLFSKEMSALSDSESDEDDYKPKKKLKLVKGQEDDDDEDDERARKVGGFEIAPLAPEHSGDNHSANPSFIIDSAEKYAMAEQMLAKGSRRDAMDDAFNRFSWNDPEGVPSWFLEDEKRHSKRHLPITKEAVQIMKARLRALDAQPIKKVAEAKFRQKLKAENKMKKALKKASAIVDTEDVPDKTKLRDAAKIMAKATMQKAKKPTLVVARNQNRAIQGRPKGVKGRYKVNWPRFSPDFLAKAREQLTTALNKGDKPANIVDNIVVKELNMGTKPPELEILEIGELAEERFRGIFKLTYSGDAYVVLQTKVQANPLNLPKQHFRIGHRNSNNGMLAANLPLIVPMRLRISNLKLRGIIVLVVDKVRGITLVFKNDPLERVDVNSTFDNIPNIRRFLQNQIEGQLRKMFQDDLPLLIHNLSLEFIQKKEDDIRGPGGANMGKEPPPPEEEVEPVDVEKETFMINRPHVQKWIGNEFIEFDDGYSSDGDAQTYGYVLYRSLLTPEKTAVGLQSLVAEVGDSEMATISSILRARVTLDGDSPSVSGALADDLPRGPEDCSALIDDYVALNQILEVRAGEGTKGARYQTLESNHPLPELTLVTAIQPPPTPDLPQMRDQNFLTTLRPIAFKVLLHRTNSITTNTTINTTMVTINKILEHPKFQHHPLPPTSTILTTLNISTITILKRIHIYTPGTASPHRPKKSQSRLCFNLQTMKWQLTLRA